MARARPPERGARQVRSGMSRRSPVANTSWAPVSVRRQSKTS